MRQIREVHIVFRVLDQAVLKMGEGEIARIDCHYDYAYGMKVYYCNIILT